MGGTGAIDFFNGMWILAGFSLVILWLAVRSGQDPKAVQQCADRVKTLGSSGVESHRDADFEPAP